MQKTYIVRRSGSMFIPEEEKQPSYSFGTKRRKMTRRRPRNHSLTSPTTYMVMHIVKDIVRGVFPVITERSAQRKRVIAKKQADDLQLRNDETKRDEMKMNKDWVRFFPPIMTAKQIIGQPEAVARLRTYLTSFSLEILEVERPRFRLALIYGRSGVGKTAIVQAIARDLKFEVHTIGTRGIYQLLMTVGVANSLVGSARPLILVDDYELKADKEMKILSTFLKKYTLCNTPIIITSSRSKHEYLRPVLKECWTVGLHRLFDRDMHKIITGICHRQGCRINSDVRTSIVNASSGDVRHAANLIYTQYLGAGAQSESDHLGSIYDYVRTMLRPRPSQGVLRTISGSIHFAASIVVNNSIGWTQNIDTYGGFTETMSDVDMLENNDFNLDTSEFASHLMYIASQDPRLRVPQTSRLKPHSQAYMMRTKISKVQYEPPVFKSTKKEIDHEMNLAFAGVKKY
jgi:hypothetical protein